MDVIDVGTGTLEPESFSADVVSAHSRPLLSITFARFDTGNRHNSRSVQPPASPSARAAASTPQSSSGRSSKGDGFDVDNEVVGVVMLEIQGTSGLPRWRNTTCTKLLFHARKYKQSFHSEMDQGSLNLEEEDGTRNFQLFKLPPVTVKVAAWDSEHAPTITFGHTMLCGRGRYSFSNKNQDDADDTRTIMHLELILMLDLLSASSTRRLARSSRARLDLSKHPQTDELMFPEVTQCDTEVAQRRA
ncbi:hypothetical protein EDB85DRAFT_2162185 [Lactarius pseudohatsudake]|nr:hypothetical protein EDB85DRAFT_2162185 [Lactarius pseudohatsudake]